tara:strand:- start:1812 stop:1952 length:141 start_codon:yes stop_codon:yes gene_type:complete
MKKEHGKNSIQVLLYRWNFKMRVKFKLSSFAFRIYDNFNVVDKRKH